MNTGARQGLRESKAEIAPEDCFRPLKDLGCHCNDFKPRLEALLAYLRYILGLLLGQVPPLPVVSLLRELHCVNIKNASKNVVQLICGEHLGLVLTLCD